MNKQKGIASFAIMVAMLVMAVALPVTTKLVQQTQENRSKASGTTIAKGVQTCVGDKIVKCASDGGCDTATPGLYLWTELSNCANAGLTCKIENGVPACVTKSKPIFSTVANGTKVCLGKVVYTCNTEGGCDTAVPGGYFWIKGADCGLLTDYDCVNGECVRNGGNPTIKPTVTIPATSTCSSSNGVCTDLQTCITSGRTEIKSVTGCTGSNICCQENVDAKCASYKGSCNIGLPSNLVNNGTKYQWTCTGYGNGKSITCYADVTDQTATTTPTKAVVAPTTKPVATSTPGSTCVPRTCSALGSGYFSTSPAGNSCTFQSFENGCGGVINCYYRCSVLTPTPTLIPACGTLSGQTKGFNNGQTECYASSSIACSSLNESGFTMTNASGRCNTGICCTKNVVATSTPKPTATPTLKPTVASSNCVTTCPAGKVTAENCLGIKSSPVNMNTNNLSCALRTCYTCDLSKPADGSWCDNTNVYGCKSGVSSTNWVESDTKFTWKCNVDSCSMNKCTPTGDTRCNGDYVQICRASGLWENTVCVGGEKCITNSAGKGVCGGPCILGDKRCTWNSTQTQQVLQTCTNATSGTWTNDLTCDAGKTCVLATDKKSGMCINACIQGQTQCSGNSVQTCSSNGTWGIGSSCGSNKTCTPTGVGIAICVDNPIGCSLGTLRCFNNILQQCDTDGTWSKQLADCSSTNKKCVVFNNGGSGTCESITTSCTPNVKKCSDGNVLQTCNSAGNAWIDTDCGFDKACTPSGTNNASCVATTITDNACARCNTSLASKGDGNCDGKINELDFSVWLSEFQKGIKSKADFNCNGSVGIEDFSIWNTNFR